MMWPMYNFLDLRLFKNIGTGINGNSVYRLMRRKHSKQGKNRRHIK